MTTTLNKSDELILDLWKKRAAAKAEKARFAAAVDRRGGWRCKPDIFDKDYVPADYEDWKKGKDRPCYAVPGKPLCPDCEALQPLYLAARKASIEAAAAMRRVTSQGWRLFQIHH